MYEASFCGENRQIMNRNELKASKMIVSDKMTPMKINYDSSNIMTNKKTGKTSFPREGKIICLMFR